ncbi:prolyl 4-hydroxylase subunit alpha-2-like isoform X2 [Dreissena polymorpha]|uniref:prolyl 4-hydroxylase subunit alpha-2-like isoform X2 n=1 Tax=Dreissena polymorpha TaxID=45954 RepID=UPI002263E121|nr:prolyl 4-hydroxylase subunit alpha-2-like isoform X2 [Dreissena polymorpha]
MEYIYGAYNQCCAVHRFLFIDVVRKREGILWPEKRDVIQAALGVLNVWSVFDLDLATLTSGALSTGQSKPMSGDDIFFIGNSARDSGKLFEAITWFQYLVDHWSSFKVHEVKYTALVRTLAMALKEYGMTQRGIELLQKARDKEPADTALVRDLNYLLTTTDGRDVGKALQPVQAPADDVAIQEERFQDICRSSLNKDWPVTPKQLHCYRLRLWNYYGFSKLELLSWLPRIELIYDVINKMEAGTLIAQSGNEIVFKQRDRLGTTAYGLVDERHLSAPICEWNKAFPSLLTKVTQRLESATHLYLRHAYKNPSSDCFRMSNLGPGVPTWPRTDYFDKEMFLHTHTGNRLATIMIQLNDVAHGGQLVFPQLNITIPTIQGSAVIWENLKRNGQPSDRSIHRNCPSLVGPHWGLFKNVFYSNQLFRRRCMQYKNILFS